MFTSIRVRILVTCVAIVVAALAVTGLINYLVARSFNEGAISQNLAAIAEGQGRAIGEWIAEKSAMVAGIAPEQLDGDVAPIVTQLKAGGQFSSAYVGYPDKRSVSSEGHPSKPGYDPTARPWYKQAVATGKLIVTKPYVDHTTNKLVVTFARPVYDMSGTLKGVLAADIFLDKVVETVNAIHPTPNSFAFLVDQRGAVVAHPDAQHNLKPATDLAPSLTADALSKLSSVPAPLDVEIDGAAKLLHAVRVSGTDWMLVIALDRHDATAGMRALAGADALALVIVAAIALALVGMLTAPPFKRLSQARAAMEDIGSGSGDLTKRLPVNAQDEVAAIARSFNLFVEKMNSVMLEIRESSVSVKTAAEEISQGNRDLSARTEHAASSLQETAASMEQIHGTVKQSADSAQQAARLANDASQTATRGGDVVSEVVSTMLAISNSSRKIADIIGVIDGIAFQTNILALNAAVEAARAGEQGRGFAVVAGEVRTLAQRSAQAAKEIKQLITDSVGKVEAGTEQVTKAGATMREIVDSVQRVSQIIVEISVAANEQSDGVGQVNRAVAQLDEVTQQNAALVEQSSAAADFLREQSSNLAGVVGEFRLAERTQW
ncbi:methyl-accepting chemotaxis protein [Paraburkholderia phymatum]|uniref:methyl-accepting chemotaxis protein n=1 Tax=Paraburkholderia phymatum TaxID=148447 RepID=UPI003178CCB5